MYNFEVADNHNYYVSGLQVLVHNDCKDKVVYRALSKDDDIEKGLLAKNPKANNTEQSHIAGKKDTQFISTTKDKKIAEEKYNKDGYGVVEIDLSKVDEEVIDVSNGIHNTLTSKRHQNYAKKDAEVLIKKNIPKDAIKLIPNTKKGG